MATSMPPGAPRQPPPQILSPNFQQKPDSMLDNLQKLNLNKPPSLPNSAPTVPPFVRSPSTPSRPIAPPVGVVPRSNVPPNAGSVVPFGPAGGQPSPFGTRPPPGYLPSSMGGGQVISPGGSGAPPLGGQPGAYVSPPSALGGSIRNGPPVGVPPPMIGTIRSPSQAPSMGSFLARPPVSHPLGPPTSPFSAPLPAPTWPPEQHTAAPGAFQPPGMLGGPPSQPNQYSHQTGSSLEGSWKNSSNHLPRPIPCSSITLHDTRQGNQANPPPPATSDYIVRDTGNCSPRYMRCTVNQIPCTADILTNCGMQLALLVQPLALPHPSEDPIPVLDFGESGPIRCSRCKGYINPFMKFIDHGKRFICNFCGFVDNTPHEYQCNLGPDGRRRDADERPELCRGTVEFVATKEYMMQDPMPAVYFFLIDVSMNAIQTGATAAACAAINQVIADLPDGPRTKVGIATFDSTIHFYNLKRALQQPLMLIVPDVQDVYIPLETDVVVQLAECREHINQLLESIPSMFEDNRTAESAFFAAVKAAFLAIKSTGGKLLVFQSVLPSVGMAALSARDDEGRSNISAGDKMA
ncbi:Zinc finger, Sec23/Sec24-type [Corchorus olitorius]|uniref:Zinc finger, Sec23/Sec24-type n=1 Tax=Corchorus olitorius TaxID=93759 RepID=A0A1R3JP06_9ROSI|nr:Zinc finger, Sec23/Sec24-type [Corchorus olitorius]